MSHCSASREYFPAPAIPPGLRATTMEPGLIEISTYKATQNGNFIAHYIGLNLWEVLSDESDVCVNAGGPFGDQRMLKSKCGYGSEGDRTEIWAVRRLYRSD